MYFELKHDESPDRLPLGSIFSWRHGTWRRGRGRIYRAHGAAPIIERAYRRREAKRLKKRKLEEWRLRNLPTRRAR